MIVGPLLLLCSKFSAPLRVAGGSFSMKPRIFAAVSSVTSLPLRRRTHSLPSLTDCRPNVDSAMPLRRQNASISDSSESAVLSHLVRTPGRNGCRVLFFAAVATIRLVKNHCKPFLPTFVTSYRGWAESHASRISSASRHAQRKSDSIGAARVQRQNAAASLAHDAASQLRGRNATERFGRHDDVASVAEQSKEIHARREAFFARASSLAA